MNGDADILSLAARIFWFQIVRNELHITTFKSKTINCPMEHTEHGWQYVCQYEWLNWPESRVARANLSKTTNSMASLGCVAPRDRQI